MMLIQIQDTYMDFNFPSILKILELYHCRVHDPRVYNRYAPDAVFDDPAGILRGRPAIRVAMEALVGHISSLNVEMTSRLKL